MSNATVSRVPFKFATETSFSAYLNPSFKVLSVFRSISKRVCIGNDAFPSLVLPASRQVFMCQDSSVLISWGKLENSDQLPSNQSQSCMVNLVFSLLFHLSFAFCHFQFPGSNNQLSFIRGIFGSQSSQEQPRKKSPSKR